MNKIVMIVPYFGTLPNYFNFWLRSCEYNTEIDWLIFTDNEIESKSQNTRIIKISWIKFKEYVQSKFDFQLALNSPYKLCDLKPCYGFIFSDYIKQYDFWGHCDVDIVWGNIRKYVTDEILSKYDRIYRNGHFCLFRNIDFINKLFMKSKGLHYDYKHVLTHPESFVFDENGIPVRSRIKELLPWITKEMDPFNSMKYLGGMNTLSKDLNIRQYTNIDFDDIRQNQRSFFSTRPVDGYTLQESQKQPSLYTYNKGVLTRIVWTSLGVDITESLYIHLQKRKMSVDVLNFDCYCIIPNRFVTYNDDFEKYKRFCLYTNIYPHYWKIRYKNLIKMFHSYIKRLTNNIIK